MTKVREAIHNFLLARKSEHNGPDLIDRWEPGDETQVMVTTKGEPVEGRKKTFTDGKFTWWNIRIPKQANSEPEWNDYELSYPLDMYAEAIGGTGWNWQRRASRWVGFDFDDISGHAPGVGVSDSELAEIRRQASQLPYVETRNSTGGAGLHLIVPIDDIPTKNHTEHAALARCVLTKMSEDCGFDFSQAVDACGQCLWFWSVRATKENGGFKKLKSAKRKFTADDLPANWRDHIEVVTKQRSKVRISGIPDAELNEFEALTSGKQNCPLDADHRQFMQELASAGYTSVWVPDHHVLQTHAHGCKVVIEKLGLKGFYDTISAGQDKGGQNMFLIPKPNGAWLGIRFSKGVREHRLWQQDGKGYTSIQINVPPNFETACKACGGKETEDGSYFFPQGNDAVKAAKALGRDIEIPSPLDTRQVKLKISRSGRLVIESKSTPDDPTTIGDFVKAKRGSWQQVVGVSLPAANEDATVSEIDEKVRSLVSPDEERVGWVSRSLDGSWIRGPKDDAKSVLLSQGFSKAEVDVVVGSAAFMPWTIVALPFKTEYPGDRQWNRGAAQLRYQPGDLDFDSKPFHPHWDMVFNHCGNDLTSAISQLDWCERAGIKTGGDYLKCWLACVIREPFEPLPYNFFFGPQESGKSIIHECAALLMTRGVVSADRALTNGNDFNGELEGAVICVVEEKDISSSPHAYNRIKEWVTAIQLSIRKMRQDSYTVPNTTHWIQCANDQGNCPIFKGDTRINVIYVGELEEDTEIPKRDLMGRLEDEAPHFLKTLMDLELPQLEGRLRLPVIETHRKEKSLEIQRSSLDIFIDEKCHDAPGHFVKFNDFRKHFVDWLDPMERTEWSRNRVSRELPDRYPTGRKGSNKTQIANLSFAPPSKKLQRLTVIGGKFIPDLSGKYDE